jgi:predicted  nucleic acid-binding Zn-ribbon protein
MDLEHEKRLTEVEARAKSNEHRIDDLEARQDKFDELNASIRTLAVREKQVENDVKEIKSDVKTLTDKPGKRWEGVVDKVTVAVAAALTGYVLSRLGIS